jgi:hypothetical protein
VTGRLRVAIAVVATLWSCAAVNSARACGGPAQVAGGAVLQPLDADAVCCPSDAYGVYYRNEFLFLYPFRLTMGETLESVWRSAYGSHWTPPGAEPQTSVISIKRFRDGESMETFGSPIPWSFDVTEPSRAARPLRPRRCRGLMAGAPLGLAVLKPFYERAKSREPLATPGVIASH